MDLFIFSDTQNKVLMCPNIYHDYVNDFLITKWVVLYVFSHLCHSFHIGFYLKYGVVMGW